MTTNPKGKITKAQISKSLIDDLLVSVSGGSVAIKKNTVTITNNTSRVSIGTDLFDFDFDQLLVFKNSVYLEINNDYILNEDDYTISPLSGMWEASINEPDTFNIICLINTPNGALFSGSKIVPESITEDKLAPELQEKLNTGNRSGCYAPTVTRHSHSYVETIQTADWTYNPGYRYTKTINHGLNCNDSLIVYAIDTETKRNITVAYRITDNNSIVIESATLINIELMIIDSNELKDSLTGTSSKEISNNEIDMLNIEGDTVFIDNNRLIMVSPNGTKYKIKVSDTGELSTSKL